MERLDYANADLPYIVYEPDALESDTPLPLIIFLHGSGERGTDINLVRKWGVPKYLDSGQDIPAIVYAPQCPEIIENWSPVIDKVLAGIDALEEKYNISKTHICGFSMGGHGTQYIAVNHPERFTAIAPVATFMYPNADITENACILKDKALWYFHSQADFVPVEHSDKVVANLRDCGAKNLQYTRYEEADHVQTADLAFLNEEFYQWILKQ